MPARAWGFDSPLPHQDLQEVCSSNAGLARGTSEHAGSGESRGGLCHFRLRFCNHSATHVQDHGKEGDTMAQVDSRKDEPEGGGIRFIQITAAGSVVYGLTKEGVVFQYSQVNGRWQLLPMVSE